MAFDVLIDWFEALEAVLEHVPAISPTENPGNPTQKHEKIDKKTNQPKIKTKINI